MAQEAERNATPSGQGLQRSTMPLQLPDGLKGLHVGSHAQLMRALPVAAARVAKQPGFSVMFLLNPVLALSHYGVTLSPAMRRHVMHMVRHPPALRDRRDALEASLRKTLGEPAKPLNAAWLARFVFVRQKLAPLATEGQKPSYRPRANAAMVEALQASLPAPTNRYPKARHRFGVTSHLGLATLREPAGRLDIAAPAPSLPPAAPGCPAMLSLEQAWFYKDLDPLVAAVVELGTIQSSARRFLSPDAFRKAMRGETSTAFRGWISGLRIHDRPREGRA